MWGEYFSSGTTKSHLQSFQTYGRYLPKRDVLIVVGVSIMSLAVRWFGPVVFLVGVDPACAMRMHFSRGFSLHRGRTLFWLGLILRVENSGFYY